jgi:hypothetical protein
MTLRTRSRRAVVAAALLTMTAVAAGPTLAQTWTETGDAGDAVASAQSTTGAGALTQITGSLQFNSDVDLFCVEVSDPQTFSASLQCVMAADPSIWIFAPSGLGLAHNDVCMFSGKTIPPGFVGSGTCYVAVTQAGRQAYSAGGAMWQTFLFTGARAPDGPGAGGTLLSWSGGGPLPGVTPYILNLTGASYCGSAVPVQESGWGALKATYR